MEIQAKLQKGLFNCNLTVYLTVYNQVSFKWRPEAPCHNIPSKMWDKITYPFPYFNGCTVEVWEWRSYFTLDCIVDVITYPCWY